MLDRVNNSIQPSALDFYEQQTVDTQLTQSLINVEFHF